MIARRHLWTFLIALLLPFAQLAAAAHEVSHIQAAAQAGSKSGLHGGHCEMCAVAAQIGGGAAASDLPKLCHPDLREASPVWHFANRSWIEAVAGFDSRAPPISLLS